MRTAIPLLGKRTRGNIHARVSELMRNAAFVHSHALATARDRMIDQTKAHARHVRQSRRCYLISLLSPLAGDDPRERRFAEEQRASSRSGGVHAFPRALFGRDESRSAIFGLHSLIISDRDSSISDESPRRGIIIPRGMQIHSEESRVTRNRLRGVLVFLPRKGKGCAPQRPVDSTFSPAALRRGGFSERISVGKYRKIDNGSRELVGSRNSPLAHLSNRGTCGSRCRVQPSNEIFSDLSAAISLVESRLSLSLSLFLAVSHDGDTSGDFINDHATEESSRMPVPGRSDFEFVNVTRRLAW